MAPARHTRYRAALSLSVDAPRPTLPPCGYGAYAPYAARFAYAANAAYGFANAAMSPDGSIRGV